MKKILKEMKWIKFGTALFTMILVICSLKVQATHIVGGNIYYKCLGNNTYEITLVMRRDCFNGDPEAFFDNPASIGIFDDRGVLLTQFGSKGQLLVRYSGNVTIPTDRFVTESYCDLVGTNTVCIHEATYTTNITLPFRPGGYFFEYQRCCRNVPLVNIVNPLETGATWVTHLSEEAMQTCNSSPVFTAWTNLFLCAGKPYKFDHRAIDPDRDSLVYSLWTPNNGATKALPKPQPPSSSYQTITWNGSYNQNDQLSGPAPFKINSVTGEITATPGTLGQFLLGVKVDEFRNGKLIGTTFRDWEIKVIDCSNLVDGRIVAPALQCDNLTVNFKHESVNGKSFKWFFDYDRNRNSTSTEENPSYRYLDTGSYRIALVITKDSTCFDTTFHNLRLKNSNATKAAFKASMGNCVNSSLILSLQDQSTGVAPDARYQWVISYSGTTQGSAQNSPSFTVPNGVLATVKLTISEDGSGCTAEASKSFITSFILPEWHRDEIGVCAGDTVTIPFILQDSIRNKLTYAWLPHPSILANANTATPIISTATTGSFYIYADVSNQSGCTSRDSILIISRTKPKLDFRVENALKSLDAKFINLSDPLTNYAWDFGVSNLTSDTSSLKDPSYKFPALGKYLITLKTTDGCAPSISKLVEIGGNGIIINDTIFACNNTSIGINPKADAQYIYNWMPANKLDNSTAVNPKFVVDSQRLFTTKLFDRVTGVERGVQNVLVIPLINPNAHIDGLVVCRGDTIKIPFIKDPSITGKYTYEWEPHPAIISGGNTASPTVLSQATSPFYLYVKINNGAGCIVRDSVLIDPKAKPKLDFRVENALNSLDAKFINLSDQLSSYNWDFGVININSDTANTRDAAYKYPAKGMYTITICTRDGCAPCVSKIVNIGGNGIIITDTINACIGNTISINRKVNSNYTYVWSPADKLNNGALPNPTFKVDSQRVFTSKLFDVATGVEIGTQIVTIRIPVSDQIKAIKDTILACAGVGVALNPNGNPNLKYEWSPANVLDNPNAVNPKATVKDQTTFTVKITNPLDTCTLTKNVVVVIPSKIALDAIPDSIAACINTATPLNPNGKADPNLKYKWMPGRFLNDSTSFNPNATVSVPTIFTVTITDTRFENCSVTKTVKLNAPILDELAKVLDSIKVCAGVATPINPTGDARFKYEWSPATGLDNANIANPKANVNQTTVYTAKITDTQRGNCSVSKQVKVITAPPFTVVPAIKDSISCATNVFRNSVKSDNPKVTFEWFDGTTSLGKSDTITLRPTSKKTYKVTGTDENGCKVSADINLDPAMIIIDATAPNNGVICQGDSVRLGVNVTGSTGGLTYSWTPTNQIVSGANTANPTIRPNTSITYTVNVRNAQGCSATDTVTVRVNPVTQISASANPTTIAIGESSQITSTNVPGYTYKWSPETDLSNSNIPNPVAKPKRTTTYTLTATSPDGCVQTRSVTITVTIPDCAEPFIFLPNAFSPNGDGKNDVLFLRSNIVASMMLIIYNRWGEKVFETRNQSLGWDGTFKGKILNPDAFGYYLTVDCIDGKKFTKKGNVTIVK